MAIYTDLKTLKHKESELEFHAIIPADVLADYEKEVLADMGRDLVIPGFRKGKAPEAMVRERMNPVTIFENAAESALRDAVREIVADQKLHVLGTPQIAVTELVPQKPISFTVRFALMPDIALPDYRKIGRDIFARKNVAAVTEDELREAENQVRQMAERAEEKNLPELTDELAQKLGNFKTVTDFRAELKVSLLQEKERAAHDAKRDQIIQAIVSGAKISVPSLLIDEEYERFAADRARELERTGTSLETYLTEVKKSAEDLEKEDRAAIERELKISLIFQAIRDREAISADEREIAANVAFLKRRYPDRNAATFRRTAEAYIVQEKIFELFEPEPTKK